MEVIVVVEIYIYVDFFFGFREFFNFYYVNLYVFDEGDCDWKY